MGEIEEKIIETLKKAGKPMRPGEIAEAAGLDKKEVSAAIKTLKQQGKIIIPKRCYYGLPENE
ncbi:MAG TPA: winged helix-turn-helix transcriptional regulator [Thermoplasmatales archaeon]|nr:winged helix-turn-helix transcriptional regulator [Thermoplasmatales archaeon]